MLRESPTSEPIYASSKEEADRINQEAINQAETLMKGRIVEDKQVVTLMRYYQLVKELENVKNR